MAHEMAYDIPLHTPEVRVPLEYTWICGSHIQLVTQMVWNILDKMPHLHCSLDKMPHLQYSKSKTVK